MRFDANGNRLSSVYKTHHIHDDVVVELGSRFNGLSDKSLEIARNMVNDENIEKLDNLLSILGSILKSKS